MDRANMMTPVPASSTETVTRASPSPALEALWASGTAYLGTRLAIMGGAMTWVSDADLVAALSNAGGFGVLASGSMPPEVLNKEITATRAKTSAPFGVNLIVMHPQLDALIDVVLDHGVSHVVLAGGVPRAEHVSRIRTAGAKVMGFASALVIARKLIRQGCDALVIEGNEAGGHIGPVSTAVLAQEILPAKLPVPVFVAGGIGRGEAITGFLRQGAAGAQLGTRFVCADESNAHPAFKRRFIRAAARDAVVSPQLDVRFPVIPVRALANDGTAAFLAKQREVIGRVDAGELSQKEAQLEIEHFWAGALRRAAVNGEVDGGSLMAGQSVVFVTKQEPVASIMAELVGQANLSLSAAAY